MLFKQLYRQRIISTSFLNSTTIQIKTVFGISQTKFYHKKLSNIQTKVNKNIGIAYFCTKRQNKAHFFDENSNYFQILDVFPNSTQQQIKSAYLQMVKKYHPDLSKQQNSSTKFQLIQKAYQVLSNPQARSKHRSQLKIPNPQAYEDAEFIRKKYQNFKRKDLVPDEWQFSYKLFKKHYQQVDAKEKQYTKFPGQGQEYWVHKDQMQPQGKVYIKQFSMIVGSVGLAFGTMYYMWH